MYGTENYKIKKGQIIYLVIYLKKVSLSIYFILFFLKKKLELC